MVCRIGDVGAGPTQVLANGKQGFIDGNLGTGQIGTDVVADFLNCNTQEELCGVAEAAGLVPSPTNFGQVLAALQFLAWNPLPFAPGPIDWTPQRTGFVVGLAWGAGGGGGGCGFGAPAPNGVACGSSGAGGAFTMFMLPVTAGVPVLGQVGTGGTRGLGYATQPGPGGDTTFGPARARGGAGGVNGNGAFGASGAGGLGEIDAPAKPIINAQGGHGVVGLQQVANLVGGSLTYTVLAPAGGLSWGFQGYGGQSINVNAADAFSIGCGGNGAACDNGSGVFNGGAGGPGGLVLLGVAVA